MSDFFHRAFDYVLSSELVPVFIRMKVMRMYGYNFASDSCLWSRHIIKSKRMSLGNESFINIGFFYDGAGYLTIGSRVRIGQFVRVLTATHEIGSKEQRCTMEALIKPVSIEDGCWIGANVTILPGVTIKKGCVIGANSLVARSTNEDCVYFGNPAHLIRKIEFSHDP